MNSSVRQQLEKEYHESEDKARASNALLNSVYGSGLFDEAELYQLDALGDIRKASVLDYGCGAGWSAARLRARGAHVTGFDISQARLNEAQHCLGNDGHHPHVDLSLCAAERLPFASGSFDAVFGKQVLHHLSLDEAIPEIVRVLRPGGKAVFLEPLIHNPLLEAYRRVTPHLRSPTEKALSIGDLRWIGAHFGRWTHKEFYLLAVLPALAGAVISNAQYLVRLRRWLQKADRRLIDRFPYLGRYCWETVIVLER